MLVGTDEQTRSKKAWLQVYRALNHNTVFSRCDQALIERFPEAIQEFGNQFKMQQLKRHEADYDPSKNFVKSSAENDIIAVEKAIRGFKSTPIKDRRAFCI